MAQLGKYDMVRSAFVPFSRRSEIMTENKQFFSIIPYNNFPAIFIFNAPFDTFLISISNDVYTQGAINCI